MCQRNKSNINEDKIESRRTQNIIYLSQNKQKKERTLNEPIKESKVLLLCKKDEQKYRKERRREANAHMHIYIELPTKQNDEWIDSKHKGRSKGVPRRRNFSKNKK
jgi:hypothetical protein